MSPMFTILLINFPRKSWLIFFKGKSPFTFKGKLQIKRYLFIHCELPVEWLWGILQNVKDLVAWGKVSTMILE